MEKLAAEGGAPVRRHPPPHWPEFSEKEFLSLKGVFLNSNWVGYQKVDEFTTEFTRYLGVKYGVAVNSGTSALEIAVGAAGIGPGDEVIVPSYTFFSTASAVLKARAKPVFVDVKLEDICIDPNEIAKAITEKTKAIIVVHIAGHPADLDRIRAICDSRNLVLIEDVAQAVGSEWKGRKLGGFGELGCFSFQASKNLTAGEGGFIATNDEKLYKLCDSFSNVGRLRGQPIDEHHLLGGNYRMTEFQAAILSIQLNKLDQQISRREENVRFLNTMLKEIAGITLFERPPSATKIAYFFYGFLYDKESFNNLSKADLLYILNQEGIPFLGGYPHPVYQESAFHKNLEVFSKCFVECEKTKAIKYDVLTHQNTLRICDELIGVHQSFLLGDRKDMEDMIRAVRKVYGRFHS